MENVVLQYPSWLIALCLLLGAGYAMFHYFRNKDFSDKKGLTIALALLRGTTVSIIALLLLNPMVRSIFEEVKTPIVILGLDQSLSIAEHTSNEERIALVNSFESLENELAELYEVHTFSVGAEATPELDTQFNAPQTNLSDFLENIQDQYAHLNVGAVVLASDGIYNVGKNPLYSSIQLNAPIHTVRLGDTTIPRDVNILNIFHNEIAFLGDDFEIEVDIVANNCNGERVKVELQQYQGRKFVSLQSKDLSIASDDQFNTIPFRISAAQPGVQRFRVNVSPVANEQNSKNNSRDFFIEVLDSRISIVLVKNAPHPDIRALKSIVDNSENYELKVIDVEDDISDLKNADLVILHGLPSSDHSIDGIIDLINQERIPRLFILGGQANANAFDQVQSSLSISGTNGSTNAVQPLYNAQFDIFETDDELFQNLLDYPPLISLFGEYTPDNGASVLAFQRIGNVSTSYPLMLFNDIQGVKEGIITGEGLWRWRLVDFVRQDNHEQVDGLALKMIQYLAVRENKEKFRVRNQKNLYDDNENVYLTAEVYNNAYEPITDPEVYLTISAESGEEYNYTFSRGIDQYTLDAGRLQPGNYRYTARTTFAGKELSKTGTFAIKAIELEFYNTVADHALLRSISSEYGGKSFTVSELAALSETLKEADLKPTVAYASRTKSAMNFKWLFALLAVMLSIEWFLRRYYGRY